MNESETLIPLSERKHRRRGVRMLFSTGSSLDGEANLMTIIAHDVDVKGERLIDDSLHLNLTQSLGAGRGDKTTLIFKAKRGYWPWSRPVLSIFKVDDRE
jgi:hypothetical protein